MDQQPIYPNHEWGGFLQTNIEIDHPKNIRMHHCGHSQSCNSMCISKVAFPNLLPAQGYASPSRKLVLLQIDHNFTVGVTYICIDCQSSILSHIVPELINNLICWNCKGCIGKSVGPVQYRFTIPSLLAQCHVAGSMHRCWLSAW